MIFIESCKTEYEFYKYIQEWGSSSRRRLAGSAQWQEPPGVAGTGSGSANTKTPRKTNESAMLYCRLFIGDLSVMVSHLREIIYFNSYTSKSPGLTDDRLRVLLGDKQERLYQGVEVPVGHQWGIVQVQVYDPVSNRVYNRRPGNDTLYWIDAAADPGCGLEYSAECGDGIGCSL